MARRAPCTHSLVCPPAGVAIAMTAVTAARRRLAAAPSWSNTPGSVSISRSSVVSPQHYTHELSPGTLALPRVCTTPMGITFSSCPFSTGHPWICLVEDAEYLESKEAVSLLFGQKGKLEK